MSLSPATSPLPKYKTQPNRAKHTLKIQCKCGCTKKRAVFGRHGGTAILTTKTNQKKIVICNPGYTKTRNGCCKTAAFYKKTQKTKCAGVFVKTLSSNQTHKQFPNKDHVILVAKKTNLKRAKGWWIIMDCDTHTNTLSCPKCGNSHKKKEMPNQKWVKITQSGTFAKLKLLKKQEENKNSKLNLFLTDAKLQTEKGNPPNYNKLYSLNTELLCKKLAALKKKQDAAQK